jgi:hypothetical protein
MPLAGAGRVSADEVLHRRYGGDGLVRVNLERAGIKTVGCHVPSRPIMRHDPKGIENSA